MRKDITIENMYKKGGEKMNVSAIARQFDCSWRTADKRVHPEKYKHEKKKRIYRSKLDKYKELINQKLDNENIPATGIYSLLKIKYGYDGSYETIKNYVSKQKHQIINTLTIRFETIIGYQSQVDWKESLTLKNKDGVIYNFNIFLMVLGYSRYKYIKLTSDKTQITLFKCLTSAFEYFGGTTDEIIFDNMKTVVDHSKSDYKKVVINSKFNQYSKDAMFTIFTCRPYRPRTKGKVETLAKVMNRLKAFDNEFEDWNDLDDIVKSLLYELNNVEKSQATNQIPVKLFQKEKEYLKPVNIDLLKTYYNKPLIYKVSQESMINYRGVRYSVPIEYIGRSLSIMEDDEFISIYYNTELICKYQKSNSKRYNYKLNDYVNILKNSAYQNLSNDEIEKKAFDNFKSLENINIDRK